jgi:hypothetical protein
MKQEIVEMAKKAGISTGSRFVGNELVECVTIEVQAFAKLVAAKVEEVLTEQHMTDIHQAIKIEREACAKVCEDISPKTEPVEYGDIRWGWKYKCPYAAAIRARGEA